MTAHVVVIIDTFRAAATASQVLAAHPRDYFLVFDSVTARRLATMFPSPLLIGKPEAGVDLTYDIPNSPTQASRLDISGRTVIHRTNAAGGGVLAAPRDALILLGGLVNVAATIRAASDAPWTLRPMGHEGTTPSPEDELTAVLLAARRHGSTPDVKGDIQALRAGPGRYFFGDDQVQYPAEDFDRCTHVDAFDWAIRAEHHGDYARLIRA